MFSLRHTCCLLLILCCWLSEANAQSRLCRGSLGENIFTQGDFGRGRSVLPQNDPALAPGYTYTTWTPVNDGFYTITNNTAAWTRIWPTWLLIGDNSDDRYGYMMVVNASYQPGIFYEQVVEGVCENTLYEFSADVINIVSAGTRDHIYPNVSFLIDDVELYNTGYIPQDETWKNVGFTFKTTPGQTAVKLTLRNNAPGGRGNDIALDNISFRACGPYASINTVYPNTMCEESDFPVLNADIWSGSSSAIQWQMSGDGGNTWMDIKGATSLRLKITPQPPGAYQFRYAHAASTANLRSEKCRAVSEIFDLVVQPSVIRRTATIEAGRSYRLGTRELRKSGTYREVFPSSSGCDSTVILSLTVRSVPIRINARAESPSCMDAANGRIILNVSGGLPPLAYRWADGERKKDRSGLVPGSYEVTITDADGNTASRRVELTGPPALDVTVEMSPDGQANAKASGGTPPYTYRWSNGANIQTASGFDPRDPWVEVQDDAGCTVRKTLSIQYIAETQLIPELSIEALRSGRAVRMERVQFDADSSRIKAESLPTLRELRKFLIEHPSVIVEIGGHTNGLPEHDYCDELSTARAKEIAHWIIRQGIPENRIRYKGYGKRKPIATNATPDGRRKNQRVEVRMVERGN